MRIVCLSDTHTQHGRLDVPAGDVLIHAGDFTRSGAERDVRAFDAWLGTLPHRHKIVIAGNHDFCFERDPAARGWLTQAIYLQDEAVEVAGLRFYGSPWQPRFYDWAFNLDRGEPLRRVFARIPADTDVLITHGPPQGVLDMTSHGEAAGCEELLAAVMRVRPRLHVFGHIHEGYGQWRHNDVHFINASNCDLHYRPVHAPIVVEIGADPLH